jgi:hypothetical protein
MISARSGANLIVAAGTAMAALLYRFSPQEYRFYPRCPVYALTHHLCPGCGATRAAAELLHGHFAAAIHYNAAFVVLSPLAICYFGKICWTAVRENRVEWPQLPDWAVQTALAALLLFTLARNLTQNSL